MKQKYQKWTNLEGIMSDEKRQILYDLTYTWNLKNRTEQNKTLHRQRDQACSCQSWRVVGARTGGRQSKGINLYI